MRASIQGYLEGCKVRAIPSIREGPLPPSTSLPTALQRVVTNASQVGTHAHAKTLSTEKTHGHKCPSAGGHMCPSRHDFPLAPDSREPRNVHLCPQVFWPLRFLGWCKAGNPLLKMTRICGQGMPPDSVWKCNSRSTPKHPSSPQPVTPRPACHPVAQHAAS